MKSKTLERLLRLLLILLGVGLGLALFQLVLQLLQLTKMEIPLWLPPAGYTGAAIIGALILLLMSNKIIRHVTRLSSEMQRQFDKMPLNQVISAVTGLILGLIVAALLRQMIPSGTDMPMFATFAISAILYLLLGALGYNLGKRRSREFGAMITRLSGVREKRKITRHGYAARKFLDTCAIVDGRIMEILKTGFIEGEVILPQYVIDEVQRLADSQDEGIRERGRRGLEMLAAMKDAGMMTIDPTDDPSVADVDVKLLRAARDCGGTVITTDYNLQKAAAISSIKTLNVNALAEALRTAVTPGIRMTLRVVKEGRENGQGVGYLNDGTMVVIEDGKSLIGEEAEVTVTAVRQTSAGRMVFAKIRTE